MAYKAASNIHLNDEIIEHGEKVTKAKLGEHFDELVAAGAVVETEEFDEAFPESEEEENQPAGTPSNLEQITGTELAAPDPKDNK